MNPSTSLGTRSNVGIAKPLPPVRQAGNIWCLLVIREVYRRSVPSGCAQVKYRCRCRDKYRYLSVTQLERLHFPSKRTAYRRLQALTTLKCVKAFSPPNIPERIFYLDREGAELVAGEMHVTVDDLKWYRYSKTPKDYYFLKHFLSINDFRILLTQACAQSPMRLLGFIPEYVGEKTTQGNVKKHIRDNVCDIANKDVQYSHTPDAVFALEKEGNAALFFAEI